ncbi:hypothetical protein ACQUFY_27370 (plasmid) [Robbsia andropogonis]|uniref:hypothetical protein n=1 Tax=Robbsia andropogonis TaxID=28092 RepID=UPI003D213D65
MNNPHPKRPAPLNMRMDHEPGFIVFDAEGHAQFAWRDNRTDCFFSEADGTLLLDVVAATAWTGDSIH